MKYGSLSYESYSKDKENIEKLKRSMSRITISISNGYGIERLNQDFDFDASEQHPHNDTHIIYAQNGTMKSSFTKVLKSKESVWDYVRNIRGSCSVLFDGAEMDQANILAVPSFNNSDFAKNDRVHLLLANHELRKEYEELMSERTTALLELLDRLRTVSGIQARTTSEGIIAEFCATFDGDAPVNDRQFVRLIRSHLDQVQNAHDFIVDLPYEIAGEKYVEEFADIHKAFLDEFIARYDKVLETAAYMRGGFDTKGAEEVGKVLGDSKFFDARHSVTLVDLRDPTKPKETLVDNAKTLVELLQSDFDRVFEDNPTLKSKFKKVLKTINQKNRVGFKKLLEDRHTRQILILMKNPSQIRRQLWCGYLKGCEPYLSDLLKKDAAITKRMQDIVERAGEVKTQWDAVVSKFNNRFKHMPFELEVKNRSDILLDGANKVDLVYKYRTPDGSRYAIDDQKLRSYLSTGERKAFYLLDLLFEIELRIDSREDHLIVLDDVVDSFDYKNKYAFLEYINELSADHPNLKLIILTHNFDFFRLMQLRLFGQSNRTHSWFAERKVGQTKLVKAGQFNYFKNTKNRAACRKEAYLSLLPLARNLVEYSLIDASKNDDFVALTQCLHMLGKTKTYGDIKAIIQKYTGVDNCSDLEDTSSIHEQIIDAANHLSQVDAFNMLHNKTVLAMAIRLKAEEFMIGKLSPESVQIAKDVEKDFTRELYKLYCNLPDCDNDCRFILENVNLITPEHLHINAFMYEPLIDLSQEELSELYERVKELT